MRVIDADELIEHVWRDRLDSRERIANLVESMPTIKTVSAADVVPVVEIYDAGYKGKEVQFRIRGRLFAIRELAQ